MARGDAPSGDSHESHRSFSRDNHLAEITPNFSHTFYLTATVLPCPPECNFQSETYATPKVTKYQRCNFIIQVHQFTIKINKININLLFECVKIVEFNFNSHVFYVKYQETRFLNQDACFLNQEGRRQLLISFVSERD